MAPNKLSAVKRLTKPFLLGTVLVGLATVFSYRHSFLTDVKELREAERVRNYTWKMEMLERRARQMEELAERKSGGS